MTTLKLKENLLLLQGFEARTRQPVARRYTDYAIPAPNRLIVFATIKGPCFETI